MLSSRNDPHAALKMLEEIASLNGEESPGAIFGWRYYLSWQDHAQFPEELTEFSPGLFSEIYCKDEDSAERLMQMDKDIEIKEQVHLNMNEHIEVYSGKMIETVTGTVLCAKESMTIPAGTPHGFKCLEGPSVSSFVFTHLPELDYLVEK